MHVLPLPEFDARIAYLHIPGIDSEATLRVFLHGLGSSGIATFPEHAADRRLRASGSLLIDFPGFGYSSASNARAFSIEEMANVVARVVEELALQRCTLIGHSMGGSVAIALAYRRPDLVANLVVAEPNLDPGTGHLSGHIAIQTEEAFVARGHTLLVRSIEQQARRGEGNAQIFLGTLRQANPLALHRAAVSLRAERTPTFREQLSSVQIPRTYIHGSLSPDPDLAELTRQGINVIQIPDAGHVMMDDNPDAFVQAIAEAERRGTRAQ